MSRKGSGGTLIESGEHIPSDATVKVRGVVGGIFGEHNVTLSDLGAAIQSDAIDAVQDVDFYFDSSGSDTNPGTKAAPFKTLNRALEYINSLPRELYVTLWFNGAMRDDGEGCFIPGEHIIINRQRTRIKALPSTDTDTTIGSITVPDSVPSIYIGNATAESYKAWFAAGGATYNVTYTSGSESYEYTGQSLTEAGGLLVASDWLDESDNDNMMFLLSDMLLQSGAINVFFVAADAASSADMDLIRFDRVYFNCDSTYFAVLDAALFYKCYFFASDSSANNLIFDNCSRTIIVAADGFNFNDRALFFVMHDASAYQGVGQPTFGILGYKRQLFNVSDAMQYGASGGEIVFFNKDIADDLDMFNGFDRASFQCDVFRMIGRLKADSGSNYTPAIHCNEMIIDRRGGVVSANSEFSEIKCATLEIKDFDASDTGIEIKRLYCDTLNVDDADTAGNVTVNAGWLYVGTASGSAASVTVNASAL